MSDCPTCGGTGVVCCDDMCRGAGECIHGDGDCPTCGGEPYEGEDDYDEPIKWVPIEWDELEPRP